MSNIGEIHDFLNEIYSRANKDFFILKNQGLICKLLPADKNYIEIDGQYKEQSYPIPIIEIKNFGDIGYNLDYIFFELSFKKRDINKFMLNDIFKEFAKVELYGGKDCLRDFYNKGDTAEKVIKKIEQSDEDIIMLSVYFKYGCENTCDMFAKVNKLCRGCTL